MQKTVPTERVVWSGRGCLLSVVSNARAKRRYCCIAEGNGLLEKLTPRSVRFHLQVRQSQDSHKPTSPRPASPRASGGSGAWTADPTACPLQTSHQRPEPQFLYLENGTRIASPLSLPCSQALSSGPVGEGNGGTGPVRRLSQGHREPHGVLRKPAVLQGLRLSEGWPPLAQGLAPRLVHPHQQPGR